MKNDFKGLWPAMFTPLNEKGEPAYGEMEKLVDLLIDQDLDGLYILGSTGQGVLFREQVRKEITEHVVRFAAGRKPVIVQVGALTTEESVSLARHAEKCGANGISSVGPIYYSGSQDMALKHYETIAIGSDLPFYPYQLGDNSIPGNSSLFIKKLVEIRNVAGMKLTTNQLLEISSIRINAGEDLKLFSGSDELFCHALLCGTVGAIGTTYNLWGLQCKKVMTSFVEGNFLQTKEFMLAFQQVIQDIMPNIWTFLRAAMKLRHQIDIGATKAPLANTHLDWKMADVERILEKIDAVSPVETF